MQLIQTREGMEEKSRGTIELGPPPVESGMDSSSASLDSEGFWLNQFAESLPALELPLDCPRSHALSDERAKCKVTLDAAIVSSLQEVGERYDCSLFVVLFAGFMTLMHRLGGQDDLVLAASFNCPLDRPTHGIPPKLQANELPVRNRAEANLLFSEHLRKIKGLLKISTRYQDHFSDYILE